MKRNEIRNAALNIGGECMWGGMSNLVAPATVLAMLLTEYGASKSMIGAIDGLTQGLLLLPQVIGIYLFHSRKKRKIRLVLWHVLGVLPFLIIMGLLTFCADKLDAASYRWSMLVCYAFWCFSIGIVVAAWFDFIASLFRTEIRGTVFGLTHFGSALFGTLGALTAGWALRAYPGTDTYGWLYLIAGAIGMTSMVCWLFVDEPPKTNLPAQAPPPTFSELKKRFAQSLADANFRNFLISRILATCGFCVTAMLAIYFRSSKGGGLTAAFVAQALAAMTLGNALSAPIIGKIGDRHGHRVAIILGNACQMAVFVILLVAPGEWGCVAAYAGAGICLSCNNISHYNLVLETCPYENRTIHISFANLVIGIPLAITPIIAGFIAEAFGLRIVFTISFILSLAALLWTLFKVKEPRFIVA